MKNGGEQKGSKSVCSPNSYYPVRYRAMQNYIVESREIVGQDIDKMFSNFEDIELTKKQFSVVHMFATGYSDKLIAAQNNISIDSVRQHMNAAREKMGCSNRTEMRMVYLTRVMSKVCAHS
ncbi:helix-turn-helix transcriptional regulator [Vibrio vulnificus]|uniref:helix-turn-helix transcriptional regulator n=1 Tax=Vibrio vulnificus TaxID=672 RepID=UPI00405A3117